MNWPIFFLGIVVGWIIEWLVDLLFWRKRQKKWMADESGYLTQLSEVQAELENHRIQAAQFGEVPTGLEDTRASTETLQLRLTAVEAERDQLEAKLATMTAERQEFAEQFNRLSNLAAIAPAAAGVGLLALSRGESVDLQELSQEAGDDLTIIEGIGPRIQALLYQNGIHTYSQLAESEVEQLQAILVAGGASFRLAEPSSWPRQAKLAAASDWVRLQALKEKLTGGVRRPEVTVVQDDLTIIEGIGPKIQELLYQNGIRSYSQLAESEVEQLQAILVAGGAAFRMSDPSSWPRQAKLAAARDWVRLQSLKEQLTGGVRHPGEPAPEDDLTVIEGIGPKISASLKEHGIRTFTQLAHTDSQRLQEILAEAGPAFKLASSAVDSWPEQALLAAKGDWEQLHTLKDSLKAGRGDAGESEPRVEA